MKLLSTFFAAGLVIVSAVPALAATDPTDSSLTDSKKLSPQPPLVNEQLVTATLAPNGLPTDAELINRIVATNIPQETVVATTSTTDLRYLDRSGRPVVNGNTVEYPVGGAGQTSTATQATFTKPLPVALHAEYTTAGAGSKGVDPASVPGTSGDLRIRYTVTNTSVVKQEISYTDAGGNVRTVEQPVFSPFVGTMMATLAPGVALKDAGTAVVSTNTEGETTLLWNLVLYPPLGDYQQDLAFRVSSSSLQIPALKMQVAPVTNSQDPAVGFSAKLLSDSVAGNTKLADGLTQLDESTAKLANGAAELTKAQAASTKATKDAYTGSKGIASGTDSLAGGLIDLSSGLDALAGQSGLPAAVEATQTLADAVNAIAAGVGAASDPPIPIPTPPPLPPPIPPPLPPEVTLVQAARAAQASAAGLREGALSSAEDSNAAVAAIDDAIKAIPCPTTPPPPGTTCAYLATAKAKATSAGIKAAEVAGGLHLLNAVILARITAGLIQVSTGLKSLSAADPGVYEGLMQLQASLTTAAKATQDLATGADTASESSTELAGYTSDLATGLGKLTAGSEKILVGNEGVTEGAEALQTEGTTKLLDGVVTSSSEPALASAYLTAASNRADSSAPFPTPAGATSRVAFVYSLEPPPPVSSGSPALLGIGLIAIAALTLVVVRRIRKPV